MQQPSVTGGAMLGHRRTELVVASASFWLNDPLKKKARHVHAAERGVFCFDTQKNVFSV